MPSTSREIFIDTSGFYALLVRGDDRHDHASDFMGKASEKGQRFMTTDYTLDEAATLFKARGHTKLVPAFFEAVFGSKVCRIVWMDPERFDRAKAFFLRRLDHPWSFTDCYSFVVMKEFRLTEALSKDAHFNAAGFKALLH